MKNGKKTKSYVPWGKSKWVWQNIHRYQFKLGMALLMNKSIVQNAIFLRYGKGIIDQNHRRWCIGRLYVYAGDFFDFKAKKQSDEKAWTLMRNDVRNHIDEYTELINDTWDYYHYSIVTKPEEVIAEWNFIEQVLRKTNHNIDLLYEALEKEFPLEDYRKSEA